ncbi:MAG: PIN domain nuclease [Aeromicrobium sp.]
MILIDTSAWVEYLRRTGSVAATGVHDVLAEHVQDIVMCEPIAMELLAGATDELRHARIEQLVNGLPTLSMDDALDFRQAAALFRTARRSGRTVRKLLDCVIANVALRHDAELWHRDADFDVIASIAPLRVRSLF